MRIKIIQTLLFLLTINSVSSFATPATENTQYPINRFSINGGIGYLGGESKEYVYYENGQLLSQLNWKIDGALILKAEVNFDFLPWLTANANGWTTTDNDSAVMDDYDWTNPAQPYWTHWSHHPDTDLNDANNFDVNLRAWFLQNQNYKLGATAGFAQTSFDFLANGGCYQYDNGLTVGCIPDYLPVIGYQQTFNAAYLGLTGKYLIDKVEFNATLKYSPWVQASDIDEHYLRDITYSDSGDNSSFSSVTVTAGYHVSPQTKLFFEGTYNQFTNGKADMQLNDHATGIYLIKNAAGLDNNNYVLALGAQYTP